MRQLPPDLDGFNFTWSACAFEHLGSIKLGQEFIQNQMHCLRPGGVAVHTTEYNVLSNADTISEGETVLFRRRDVERIVKHLKGGAITSTSTSTPETAQLTSTSTCRRGAELT